MPEHHFLNEAVDERLPPLNSYLHLYRYTGEVERFLLNSVCKTLGKHGTGN